MKHIINDWVMQYYSVVREFRYFSSCLHDQFVTCFVFDSTTNTAF